MKITKERLGNVKLLNLLNEKVICLTLTEKKIQFRAKIGRGCWRTLAKKLPYIHVSNKIILSKKKKADPNALTM